MEVWMHAFSFPGRVAELARRVEKWGFDGLLVADSQNLNADVWVELALAGAATQRIGLGTGVTNPVTRHPAVTASAALTLHAETGGRAVLGLGRGDSALAQLGRHPVPAAELERAVAAIQGYLRGEEVELDGVRSQIRWVADVPHPKPPVAVAATGPHVIRLAARHADRIDLTVGAEAARLRWAVETAHEAATVGPPSLGAFLNVAVDPDKAAARDLVRGSVAIFARFATEGAPPDGLSDVTRVGIERLAAAYDENRHGDAAAPHARGLEDEFVDRFALAGPAEEVAERLAEIASLGIERVVVVPGSLDADPARIAASNERFAAEVLPRLAEPAGH
ncbi:MAG TPA: LLM class flavin-dependent oxidoreductase [Solirubrobacterales bacterium]|nr:LLM class flavin-dependent oxidoreductase [Solirubrobacterales bacterium]